MKRCLIICIAIVSAVQMMSAQDETIVFTPQWTAQAQFAGYYVAEAKGFYSEAGVKVRIEHPTVTQPAMSRLRKNLCQATTMQLCQALEFVDECGEKDVIIDCAGLSYISSAGLRIFLGILQNAQEKGRHVYIRNITDNVRAIFTLTGFSNIFEFM